MSNEQNNQTVINVELELSKWIAHLQDQDSTGAWNDNDSEFFAEIVDALVSKRGDK